MQIDHHNPFFCYGNCLSVHKLIYTLRSSPSYIDQESLQGLDEAIAVAARQICNVVFIANDLTIVTMPVNYGGVGLCHPTNVAHLASTAISKDLITSCSPQTVIFTGMPKGTLGQHHFPSMLSIQSEWDATLVRSKRDAVLAQSDEHRRARILSASTFPSGA